VAQIHAPFKELLHEEFHRHGRTSAGVLCNKFAMFDGVHKVIRSRCKTVIDPSPKAIFAMGELLNKFCPNTPAPGGATCRVCFFYAWSFLHSPACIISAAPLATSTLCFSCWHFKGSRWAVGCCIKQGVVNGGFSLQAWFCRSARQRPGGGLPGVHAQCRAHCGRAGNPILW
jgi:hypothetical protein